MNLKKTLNEINDYFANKLLNGDYKFISCDEHTAKLIFDDKYNFEVWIANNPENNFGFHFNYLSAERSLFSDLGNTFKTNDERLKAWEKLKPHVTVYKKEQLRREKEEMIKKLEDELNNI